MSIVILKTGVVKNAEAFKDFANEWYPNFLKGTVDIELGRVALGGEWHIESCELLTSSGSTKDNVWGFNILYSDDGNKLEYHSLINIKPTLNHKKSLITEEDLIKKINHVIFKYIEL